MSVSNVQPAVYVESEGRTYRAEGVVRDQARKYKQITERGKLHKDVGCVTIAIAVCCAFATLAGAIKSLVCGLSPIGIACVMYSREGENDSAITQIKRDLERELQNASRLEEGAPLDEAQTIHL